MSKTKISAYIIKTLQSKQAKTSDFSPVIILQSWYQSALILRWIGTRIKNTSVSSCWISSWVVTDISSWVYRMLLLWGTFLVSHHQGWDVSGVWQGVWTSFSEPFDWAITANQYRHRVEGYRWVFSTGEWGRGHQSGGARWRFWRGT